MFDQHPNFNSVLNDERKSRCRHSTSHVCCVALDDDSLRRFWEIEDYNLQEPALSPKEKRLSPEENRVMEHFDKYHTRDKDGRFVVPLPRKENVPPLGESKTQAIRTFKSLER